MLIIIILIYHLKTFYQTHPPRAMAIEAFELFHLTRVTKDQRNLHHDSRNTRYAEYYPSVFPRGRARVNAVWLPRGLGLGAGCRFSPSGVRHRETSRSVPCQWGVSLKTSRSVPCQRGVSSKTHVWKKIKINHLLETGTDPTSTHLIQLILSNK